MKIDSEEILQIWLERIQEYQLLAILAHPIQQMKELLHLMSIREDKVSITN